MSGRGCIRAFFGVVVVAFVVVAPILASETSPAGTLPERLTDDEFWHLIVDLSEPDGSFHSENFSSNENAFQLVIPELQKRLEPGGVYLGVGPEQNFTYIVALKSRFAFILDIRRQNLLEHLLYKALIETSADRAEFLSRLFSRAPDTPSPNATAQALFASLRVAAPLPELFQKNLRAVDDWLLNHHRFPLTADDLERIHHVYEQFYLYGPSLSYSFPGAGTGVLELFPAYSELMTATDSAAVPRSYVATEENFRALQELERNNLIVPVVGDFAGPKALQAIGRYVTDHGATLSVFYTSNVEQYLFQDDAVWKKFYSNVRTLPTNEHSLFIRSVANDRPQVLGQIRLSLPQLSSIKRALSAFESGQLTVYSDIVGMSE